MGVKAKSPVQNNDKVFLGAGAIYFNYGEVDEACIGATKGGSSFNDNVTFKRIESDGEYGDTKGSKQINSFKPVLNVNALELDTANLQKFYAGFDVDTQDVTYDKARRRVAITDSDYLVNVAFVGQNSAGKDIILIVENALGDGSLQLAMQKEQELIPNVQFTGHADPTTPEVMPYEIWYEK